MSRSEGEAAVGATARWRSREAQTEPGGAMLEFKGEGIVGTSTKGESTRWWSTSRLESTLRADEDCGGDAGVQG